MVKESIERGWRGFKADWYLKDKKEQEKEKKPMISDEAYARALEKASGGKRNV